MVACIEDGTKEGQTESRHRGLPLSRHRRVRPLVQSGRWRPQSALQDGKEGDKCVCVCVEVIWKEEKRQTAMTLTLIRREDEDLADAEADAVGDVPELVGSAEAEERKAVRGPVVAEEEEAAPAALVGADVRRAVDEEQHHDLGAQVQQTCAAFRVGVADVVKVHLVSALGIVCALFRVCVMLQCHVAG